MCKNDGAKIEVEIEWELWCLASLTRNQSLNSILQVTINNFPIMNKTLRLKLAHVEWAPEPSLMQSSDEE